MQPHGKTFLFGLVGVVQGRLGWADDEARKLTPEINAIIRDSCWLINSEFDTIHYVMRFGASFEERIHCRYLSKYQELAVASQLSMSDLHEVILSRPGIRVLLCTELARVFRFLQLEYSLPPIPPLYQWLQESGDA
jgi:hypothetical protein